MAKTANELFQEAKTRLSQETSLVANTPGSIARSLLQAHCDQVGELYRYLDARMLQAFVSTASGESLDAIGLLVGRKRRDASFANGYVTFSINTDVNMTVQDLLDLMEERDGITRTEIPIPQGTIVRSGDKSYALVTDAVLTPAEASDEVEVIATLAGAGGNADQGAITIIQWPTPILTVLSDLVVVTNTAPIESAVNIQDDEEFRYIVTNAVVAAASSNETAIRLACLSVPGVADVTIQPYSKGIGTFSVFVLSSSPITTRGTLQAVQQAIDFTKAAGTYGEAVSPTLIGLRMTLAIEFLPTTKASDKDPIMKQAQLNAIDYINNIRPGNEMVLNELIQRVMDTSTEIHDMYVTQMSMGEYDIDTGLVEEDQTVIVGNQSTDIDEKFVSNKTLLTACTI